MSFVQNVNLLSWMLTIAFICIPILIVLRVRESHKKWEAQQQELRQRRNVRDDAGAR